MTIYYNPQGAYGSTPGDWMWGPPETKKVAPRLVRTVDGKSVDANPKPKSWLERLYDEQRKMTDEAKAANEGRYNEGRSLLGLNGPNGQQMGNRGGMLSDSANPVPLPVSSVDPNMPWASMTPAMPTKITEPGAQVRQDAVSRGIYNTSGAMNQEGLTNSLALREADRADRALTLQDRQQGINNQYRDREFAYGASQDAANRADQLRSQRLAWIEGRQDPYPDQSVIATLAGQLGQGSREGLDPGAFTGGYGGGLGAGAYGGFANSGFNIPSAAYGIDTGGNYQWDAPGLVSKPAPVKTAPPLKMTTPMQVGDAAPLRRANAAAKNVGRLAARKLVPDLT